MQADASWGVEAFSDCASGSVDHAAAVAFIRAQQFPATDAQNSVVLLAALY